MGRGARDASGALAEREARRQLATDEGHRVHGATPVGEEVAAAGVLVPVGGVTGSDRHTLVRVDRDVEPVQADADPWIDAV